MFRSMCFIGFMGMASVAYAQAWIPALNHSCPSQTTVKVTAKAGGPVFINGKQATVKKFSATYFEASSPALKFKASVMTEAGSAPSVSYTGPGKLNGICAAINSSAPAVAASGPAAIARKSCQAEVARTTGKPATSISFIDSSESQAGFVLNFKVPGATAPWRCLTGRDGKVGGVMFTGDEGKL